MIYSYILANLIPKIFSIITLSLIINELNLNQYSTFDFILVSSGILFPLLSACLCDGYYHFALKYNKKHYYNDVVSFVNIVHLFSFVILLCVSFIKPIWYQYLFIVLLSFGQAKIYLTKSYCRVNECKYKFVLCELIPSVFIFLLVFFLSKTNIKTEGLLWCYLFIYFFCWLTTTYLLNKKDYFKLSANIPRELLVYSVPLIPNAIIALLAFNLFRYINIGEVSDLYVLNYRVIMFYIVVNSIFYMFIQDLKYKTAMSDIKYIMISSLIILIFFPMLYLCIDIVIPYYLSGKENELNRDIYNLSVIAMFIYVFSSVLSVCLNYKNKPNLILLANAMSLIIILSSIVFGGDSIYVYAYAMIFGFSASLLFRCFCLIFFTWNNYVNKESF